MKKTRSAEKGRNTTKNPSIYEAVKFMLLSSVFHIVLYESPVVTCQKSREKRYSDQAILLKNRQHLLILENIVR